VVGTEKEDKIYFIRATPFIELIIPIEQVREISLPTSFNGKSVF